MCDIHTRYKGKKIPENDCEQCWDLWISGQPTGRTEKYYSEHSGVPNSEEYNLEGSIPSAIVYLQDVYEFILAKGGIDPQLEVYYGCDSNYLCIKYYMEETEEEKAKRLYKIKNDVIKRYQREYKEYLKMQKKFGNGQ